MSVRCLCKVKYGACQNWELLLYRCLSCPRGFTEALHTLHQKNFRRFFFRVFLLYLEEQIYLVEYIFIYFVCVYIYICLNHCLIPYALNIFIKLITLDWRLIDFHGKFSYSNKDLLGWNNSCFPYNFSNTWQKSLYFSLLFQNVTLLF